MVSADTIERAWVAEEQNRAGMTSAVYRKKDKAFRKCPKCGNHVTIKASLENFDGVFSDSMIGILCVNCFEVLEMDEIDSE